MRRTMLLMATMAFALLLAGGVAMAADPYGTLDANTLGGPENSDSSIVNTERGQTFVALGSGQLTGAQLKLYRSSASTDGLNGLSVGVWSLDSSGLPQTRLAFATVAAEDVPFSAPALVGVTFDRQPLVRAGQKYALLASSQSEWVYGWANYNNDFDSSADIYPDGGGMVEFDWGWQPFPNLDFIFATFVNNRPVVGDPGPAPGSTVTSHRPIISATVDDAETELTESAVSLFVDGRTIGRRHFVYDAGSDRLTYRPPSRLDSGRHTIKVVAADERGLTETKRWAFKIK